VTKEFKRSKILQDVNISIEEGDIYGIIGQSGSGKTTLLNLIGGYLRPSEGTVAYFSAVDHQPKELRKHFHKIKRHLGFTHQHYSFYPKLTVKENLLHFGRLMGMKKTLLIENAKSLLRFTGLYDHRNKLSEHLSGGMQRRLDIACSLIHKPKVLLLDEPTADLDPLLQEEILNLLKAVNKQGITIIIASHHLESLERICSKIAFVHNGTVRSFGDFEEVRKPFLKDKITINIRPGKDKDKFMAIAQRLPVSKIIDQGHRIVLESADPAQTIYQLLKLNQEENLSLNDIDFRRPSLNEIFEKVAGEKI
tara:strand:- start:649 stop:1572 length:924 start_codon:yes stop_codon:yes gene_type:complete